MDFEECTPEENNEIEIDQLTPDPLVEEAKNQKTEGVFSFLANSSIGKSLAFLASTALGSGTLISSVGCVQDEGSDAYTVIEKEAKFSTIGNEAKISLSESPTYLKSRETVKEKVTSLLGPINTLIQNIEETHSLPGDNLQKLQFKIKEAHQDLNKLTSTESYQSCKSNLQELDQRLKSVVNLNSSEFISNIDSPAYQKVIQLQQQLYDWNDALERDIVNLKLAVHAGDLASLSQSLDTASSKLTQMSNLPSLSSSWLSANKNEVAVTISALETAESQLKKAASAEAFREIKDDLNDCANLISDTKFAFKNENQPEYFNNNTPTKSAGVVLIKETNDLLKALNADLKKELFSTIGVQNSSVANNNTENTNFNTAQGHSGGSSSNNFLLWYMLFNRNNGYHGGYTYIPKSNHEYSGSNRLRSSAEYGSFSNTSHENHGTLAGKSDLNSHKSTSGGGRSVSSNSFNKISNAGNHPNSNTRSASPGSGFGKGSSFKSGFGG